MLRAFSEGVFLFLLPFAGFAVFLLLEGQNPLHPEVWSRKALSWLTIGALVLCIIGVVALGTTKRDLEQGTFVPSHVDKDGTFVPGQFKN
jgi:hypothetical protein